MMMIVMMIVMMMMMIIMHIICFLEQHVPVLSLVKSTAIPKANSVQPTSRQMFG